MLFYSPLLDAVARIPSKDLRLTESSAVDRLKGLGYADPKAALRHIAALSQGVTRQAEIAAALSPAMLGWFATAPNPDHGRRPFARSSDTLGSTPWYLRALRDEGMMAERLARILASSRYAVALLQRAPQTMQMLADDAGWCRGRSRTCEPRSQAAAGRSDDPVAAVESIRAIRRREVSGSPPATCSGPVTWSWSGAPCRSWPPRPSTPLSRWFAVPPTPSRSRRSPSSGWFVGVVGSCRTPPTPT